MTLLTVRHADFQYWVALFRQLHDCSELFDPNRVFLLMYPFSGWICRFGSVLFSAHLHENYRQEKPFRPALPPPVMANFCIFTDTMALRSNHYSAADMR